MPALKNRIESGRNRQNWRTTVLFCSHCVNLTTVDHGPMGRACAVQWLYTYIRSLKSRICRPTCNHICCLQPGLHAKCKLLVLLPATSGTQPHPGPTMVEPGAAPSAKSRRPNPSGHGLGVDGVTVLVRKGVMGFSGRLIVLRIV